MVLTDPQAINAAKVPATTRVTVTTLATSVAIDNENLRVGLVRKVRRMILQNLDNNTLVVHFATQDAAAANDANLNFAIMLDNFRVYTYEPELVNETGLQFLATALARRLSAYVRNMDDTGAPAGIVNGVRVTLEYWDDLEA